MRSVSRIHNIMHISNLTRKQTAKEMRNILANESLPRKLMLERPQCITKLK